MRRYQSTTAVFFLFAFSGCQETELRRVTVSLNVEPPVLDVGDIPVGSQTMGSILISSTALDSITLTDVEVTNESGAWFTYDGDLPMEFVDNVEGVIQVRYAPLEEGWHHATVTLHSNATNETVDVVVRGHAVPVMVSIIPMWVDFGVVEPLNTGVEQIQLTNLTDVDLEVSDAFIDAPFSLDADLPFSLPARMPVDVSVLFDPVDSFPAAGALAMVVFDTALPTVLLTGNDCLGGLPEAYDRDEDGYATCGGDCDDTDATIHPSSNEVYDGVDQDCDGTVDEGTVGYDDDGDGFCEHTVDCTYGLPGDCNDGVAEVSPGVFELPNNGIDDNCDGTIDDGEPDLDGDGYAVLGGDCDDSNPNMWPGNDEDPDFQDNDCDGTVDEGTSYYDDDGDGFCDDIICSDGSTTLDCDDEALDRNGDGVPDGQTTFPGAQELPDWRDNDCDGIVDEETVRYDDDGDGFTEIGGDCDDSDPNISPATGDCP